MKLTNRLNLPEPVLKAIQAGRARYSKGNSDYSTTELSGPPRIRQLKLRHDDEIEEDISDMIYSLQGQIGHALLEMAAEGGDNDIVEKRYFYKVGDKIVSGQADLIRSPNTNHFGIYDWKFSSIFQFKDGIKTDYVAQLNIIEYLVTMSEREQGNEVVIDGLYSVPIYRDWSKNRVGKAAGYPETPIEVLTCPRWGLKKTEDYIKEMIRKHERAAKLPDAMLPLCSPEDRWERGEAYAVIAEGSKRATAMFYADTPDAKGKAEEEAHQRTEKTRKLSKKTNTLGEPTKTYRVEHRPAEPIRCLSYCPVAQFCNFGREAKMRFAETSED